MKNIFFLNIKKIILSISTLCFMANISLANHNKVIETKQQQLISKLISLNYDFYKYPKEYSDIKRIGDNASLPPVYYQSYYMNIIIKALKEDNVSLIKMIINEYNIKDPKFYDNDNLLILAAHNNSINIVRYLLMKKYPINYTNNFGLTALHVASLTNNYDMAKLLLTMGADYTIKDNDNNTPMSYINDIHMNELFILYIDNAVLRYKQKK
jgi:ankyrin repeat protein